MTCREKLVEMIGEAGYHAFSVGTDASKLDALMDWCEKQNEAIRYLLGRVKHLESLLPPEDQ